MGERGEIKMSACYDQRAHGIVLIRWCGDNDASAPKRSNQTYFMATNPPKGDGHRNGAVRERSQFQTPSGHWAKRDARTGRILDVKTSSTAPHKGVRRED